MEKSESENNVTPLGHGEQIQVDKLAGEIRQRIDKITGAYTKTLELLQQKESLLTDELKKTTYSESVDRISQIKGDIIRLHEIEKDLLHLINVLEEQDAALKELWLNIEDRIDEEGY